jgi:transposase
MARYIHLEPHLSADELARRYRRTKDPVEQSRWHFLWLLARGLTAKAIAGITEYSTYWIGRIARRYNERGPDGVKDQRHRVRSGRRLLTTAQQDALLVVLGEPAPQHERWNGRTVAEWIAHSLARPVCRQLGWAYLRRLGARLRLPRSRHVHADLQAQTDFKRRLRPLLRAVSTAFPQASVEQWAIDEHQRHDRHRRDGNCRHEGRRTRPLPRRLYRFKGKAAIKALSWDEVEALRQRFAALNPYDRSVVPGSILEIEKENVDADGHQRQLWCYAISAKRYALFTLDEQGWPYLIKWSEHGLGHLLNPTDPESEDRDWIRQLWDGIIHEALGQPYSWPEWLDPPAIGRITASSPQLLQPFADWNRGKPYAEQVKPFNFLLSAHVAPFGLPDGVDGTRFHLIAPYEGDARKWLTPPWTDRSTGKQYAITTTTSPYATRAVRVKSYRDVLDDYRTHPEAKSLSPDGGLCRRTTVGLLRRRTVTMLSLTHVGKESNLLEEVEAGLVHDPDEVYTEYVDVRRDPA